MRKLLPPYILMGLSMLAWAVAAVGCASPTFQADVATVTYSPRYLALELRYQQNGKDLVAYAKDHPTDSVSDLLAVDADTYNAIAKARMDNYAASDLDAVEADLSLYETALNQKGAKGYVARTHTAH